MMTGTGRMIDHVPPGSARRAPLKRTKLGNQAPMIQQLGPAAVQDWQQFGVNFAFAPLAEAIGNAMRLPLLGWPRPRVPVAKNLGEPIAARRRGKFRRRAARIERRFDLANAIENSDAILGMADR